MSNQEKQWAIDKRKCLIRYLVDNPPIARNKLKKMNNQIKRNSNGVVDKKSMMLFQEMEQLRKELNEERLRR